MYEYCAKAKRDELVPRPLPGRVPQFKVQEQERLKSLVQENPNLTLDQMRRLWQERTGRLVARSSSTLHDALRRAGMRFKKTRVALERDVAKRAAFEEALGQIAPQKLIDGDECSVEWNQNLGPTRAQPLFKGAYG